jgi:hypothetical protein
MPLSVAPEDHEPGTSVIDHSLPFHNSARGTAGPEPLEPTAMQSVSERQLTPSNVASVEPVGFGEGTIDHSVPSQTSAKVDLVEAATTEYEPTAMQKDGAGHETPIN